MHSDDRTHDRAARNPGTDDARTDEQGLEVVVETVKHGIDQVAEKVKGLLRSGR